jgi:glycerol kinase
MAATDQRVRSTHGLSSTIAWSRGGSVQHALEGNILVSGHAAAFATALLGLDDETALTRLAETVDDDGGVVFVPALAGLGAPHWSSDARGTITGLSLATKPGHVARATLEAIALQITDVLAALDADLGTFLAELSVDGGASRNELLMRLLADLSGRTIVRPALAEASALGAARMARDALGIAASPARTEGTDRFTATLSADAREQIVDRWRAAIRSAIREATKEA